MINFNKQFNILDINADVLLNTFRCFYCQNKMEEVDDSRRRHSSYDYLIDCHACDNQVRYTILDQKISSICFVKKYNDIQCSFYYYEDELCIYEQYKGKLIRKIKLQEPLQLIITPDNYQTKLPLFLIYS